MAKARGRTAAATKADVQLDASAEHEALTPVMRRVANEYWEIVRDHAAEQGLPIVRAWLSPYIDMEDNRLVHLVVHFDVTREQALAFGCETDPDHHRWEAQLDAEAREASRRLWLMVAGLRRTEASVHGA